MVREEHLTFLIISHSVLFRIRHFSDKVVEKIKTYFMFNNFFSKMELFMK